VGPNRLTARMREAGVRFELPLDAGPSLAVGLGGVGLTLRDLTQLYCGLARGGESVQLTHQLNARLPLTLALSPQGRGDQNTGASVQSSPLPAGERDRVRASIPTAVASPRLLTPVADWYVQSILRGTAPPRNAKGGEVAYKTGTSYGFRDAWAAGFDGRHTIAVWVGRPDGVPEPGITGVGTAAPILFDAFARLPGRRAPLPPAPEGAVVGVDLPPPLKIFGGDQPDRTAGKPFADPELAIAFPPDNAELELGDARPVVLKAEGGVLPLTWMVDDAPVPSDGFSREASFVPAGRGFARVSVVDATGKVDRVQVTLH